MSPDDHRHGTNAGYQVHRRTKTPPCDPCRAGRRAYVNERRTRIIGTRSPESVEAILKDYTAGIRMKEISARHGLSAESVRTLARAAGIAKREYPIAYCTACCGRLRLNPEGLCANCALDVPLEGGRWVRRGLVQVWIQDVAC